MLTTEPINTIDAVVQIVKDYERRWVLEGMHKVWKTGCRLEERPFESLEAIETMLAVTLPIAGRLMRLHTAARSQEAIYDVVTPLSDNEVKCVWQRPNAHPTSEN